MDGKYGKLLTVLLVIVIIAVLGLLIFLGYDIISGANNKKEVSEVLDQYNNIENKNYTIIESWVKLMANVSIRMDDALKKQAEELFNDLGMNLTTAFTIFVKQAIREQGIPFEITKETPNSETLSALREVEEMKKKPSLGKSYTDVDKMMEDLLSWNIH